MDWARTSWASAWDPPQWDEEPAADGDLEPTKESPNQGEPEPQEAAMAAPGTVAVAATTVPAAISAVAAAVVASGHMHFTHTDVQTEISFPCDGEGHTVP